MPPPSPGVLVVTAPSIASWPSTCTQAKTCTCHDSVQIDALALQWRTRCCNVLSEMTTTMPLEQAVLASVSAAPTSWSPQDGCQPAPAGGPRHASRSSRDMIPSPRMGTCQAAPRRCTRTPRHSCSFLRLPSTSSTSPGLWLQLLLRQVSKDLRHVMSCLAIEAVSEAPLHASSHSTGLLLLHVGDAQVAMRCFHASARMLVLVGLRLLHCATTSMHVSAPASTCPRRSCP